MKGQCYCGKVQYEFEKPLKFIAHDHCSICRRISGAGFVTWCGVLKEQLKVTAGADYLRSFQSTPDAERNFCKNCGTHLFFRSSRWPGEIHFTLATVTSKLDEQPRAHVFFTDKAEWIHIHDDLPKYGGEKGTEPLV